ncbi:phosphonopyruvate decarboxylase [Paenibacillus xerothermodurans]
MSTSDFGEELKKLGFTLFTGVPCSFLKSLINYAINECEYVAAANEGDAVAIAAGAYVGGRKPVVLMQNSGLTNAVSPLTSLNYPFRIPTLGFVSLRGEPGIPDEPQHQLMGPITTKMLDLMQVEWQYLSDDLEEARRQLAEADRHIANHRTFFFVVKRGTLGPQDLGPQSSFVRVNQLKKKSSGKNQMPARREALSVINALKDRHTVQLATTGVTGRELYEVEDSSNNFYMVGSMGCVSSFGLGLSLAQTGKDVIVIDGDGSLLMRMGSLATNGYYNPSNMLHILLDNNAHDSTGGQSTVSHNVDFIEIAASCGYTKALHVHNLDELAAAMTEWKKTKGLTFLYMKISKSSSADLGRPRIKPYEVKERLQRFLNIPTTGK